MRQIVILCVSLFVCGADAFASTPTMPHSFRPFVSLRTTSPAQFAVKMSIPQARKPYILTGFPRPQFRGALVGVLHRSKAWYLLAAAYVAAAFKLSAASVVPLTQTELALRIAAAVITSANVFISDQYHNADLKGTSSQDAEPRVFIGDQYPNADLRGAYSRKHELFWMRLDYVGISAILAYNQFLWGGNCGWHCATRLAAGYSGACLAAVSLLAPKLDGNRDGSTKLVKYITGTQFMPASELRCAENTNRPGAPRLWSGVTLTRAQSARKSRFSHPTISYLPCTFAVTYLVLTMGGALARNVIIYTLYASGLVLYVSKRPQSMRFGFHEIFHCLVVLGHLASMGLDLADIAAPAARVGAGLWVHRAAPLSTVALPLVLAPWLMLLALLPNKRRLFEKIGKLAKRGS